LIAAIKGSGSLTFRAHCRANNRLTEARGLEHLSSLTEVNLRRNHICKVSFHQHPTSLRRLFLSDNDIPDLHAADDIFSLWSVGPMRYLPQFVS